MTSNVPDSSLRSQLRPAEYCEDRDPVDVLADSYANRIRDGEDPSLDEYVQDHPELETAIRAVFPTIRKMEIASQERMSSVSNSGGTSHFDLPPQEQIGDFRIVRTLGRGGMGIVYQALQISLQRQVALKVISPAISNSPKQLERFKREAATAARLHHTNIVPVFGSGEDNNTHYYAMQLIDGIPLHEAVHNIRESRSFRLETQSTINEIEKSGVHPRELNAGESPRETDVGSGLRQRKPPGVLQPRQVEDSKTQETKSGKSPAFFQKQKNSYRMRVCECIADVADALHYAHEKGVLHRDVKPANLLMDLNGTVWITDFGLAKLDENDVLTKSGDMVGTLRYMAPEQFSGISDRKSDICSLGLTLFELLALQPAYSETRSGPLLKLKTEQPPPSPRIHDPEIPKDLETIVLKACSIQPNDRYRTAANFRDDLKLFVEGRPIAARRIGAFEQFWRWSARNPLVSSLSGLSAILLIAIATVALVGNHQTRQALKEKEVEFLRAEENNHNTEIALQEVEKQRELAEDNFSTAIAAFEEIMSNISRRGIPQGIEVAVENDEVRSFETSLTQSDIEVLETLLEFFARFAEKNRANLLFQSAQAQKRVGDILQGLGRLTEAEAVYATALESFSKIQEQNFPDVKKRLVQMRITNQMAYCSNRRGDFETAERHLAGCRNIFNLASETTPEIQLELARSLNIFTAMYTRVGYVLNRRTFTTGAARKFEKSSPKKEKPVMDSRPKSPNRKSGSVSRRQRTWINLSSLFAEKKSDVKKANVESIKLLLKLSEQDENNSQVLLELSRAFQERVRINRYAKDQRAIVEAFDEAKKILERLMAEYPNNPAYQFELADLHCNLQRNNNRPLGANTAIKLARDLAQKWPGVSEYQALYANALARSAISRFDNQPLAVKRLEDAIDIYRRLIENFPDHYVYKINFSQYLSLLGAKISELGDLEKAGGVFDEATNCLSGIVAENGSDTLITRILADVTAARKTAELGREPVCD